MAEGERGSSQASYEHLVANIHMKIHEAFHIFDHEQNSTVDVREIGTIIRSLNCCPTEYELQDILAEVEEDDPPGYVKYQKFLPVMTQILMERRLSPAPEDKILKAFHVIDPESKGVFTVEELTHLLTTEGEPFNKEEIEETLSAVVDQETGMVDLKRFSAMLVVEDNS